MPSRRCADHGVQIPPEPMSKTVVRNNKIENVSALLTAFIDLQGRDAQPVLPDVAASWVVASRHGSAVIALMGARTTGNKIGLRLKKHKRSEIID